MGRQHDGQARAAARPGSGSSRCRALATIAPVDPAETTAEAWPRRTSWQAMARLDRGRRKPARAPSSIPTTSSAGTTRSSEPAPSRAMTGRSRAGGPVSSVVSPCSRWAASAPATISSGA